MRNPVAYVRWLVVLISIGLAVWFGYKVFVEPGQGSAVTASAVAPLSAAPSL